MPDYRPLANHGNDDRDIERAKELRKTATYEERLLWNQLRDLSKTGFKFRRQHPLHPYIVDFVCLKAGLIIEIDGPSHDVRQAYDDERARRLKEMGYDVLRFSNKDIYENRESAIMQILETLKQR